MAILCTGKIMTKIIDEVEKKLLKLSKDGKKRTHRELKQELGISSTSMIHRAINNLHQKGYEISFRKPKKQSYKRPIADYQIVNAPSVAELRRLVGELLEKGYVLQGGIAISNSFINRANVILSHYYQAMIKFL